MTPHAEARGGDPYLSRIRRLREVLRGLSRVAVAYSGGVDSSVLLHAAFAELGADAAGVIADSPSLPRRELEEARATARAIGAPLAEIRTDELEDERYRQNRGDRCYFCKSALFRAMEGWARGRDIRWLLFGEIADDLQDDRPGARAAREFGVLAPLSQCGLTKEDVRRYAREAGLPVAEKAASACLASRLPPGTAVTRERLARVERGEEALRGLGLRRLRVRDHGDLGLVEVGIEDLDRARAAALEVARLLGEEGFARVEIRRYLSATEKREPGEPAAGAGS